MYCFKITNTDAGLTRKKKKKFDSIFTRFYPERTLLFLVFILINVPLLISNNSCFRENLDSSLCFFFPLSFPFGADGRRATCHMISPGPLSGRPGTVQRGSFGAAEAEAGGVFWLAGRESQSETPPAAN